MRQYRFALRPRWFGLHLFTVALAVTMVLLGRWQLHVSESKGFSLQNFGYSIQWWLFSAFAVFFWSRLLRDAARRLADPEAGVVVAAPEETPVAYRRYVMPTATDTAGDPVRSAYNDYLADLARKDAQTS